MNWDEINSDQNLSIRGIFLECVRGWGGEGLGGGCVCFGISAFCEFCSLHSNVGAVAERAGVSIIALLLGVVSSAQRGAL